MSGGRFDYLQYRIEDISSEIEHLIKTNDSQEIDDFGDKIGREYSPETIRKFKLAVFKLREAEIYAQRIDWLVSGDDGEDTFHKRLGDDLDKLFDDMTLGV